MIKKSLLPPMFQKEIESILCEIFESIQITTTFLPIKDLYMEIFESSYIRVQIYILTFASLFSNSYSSNFQTKFLNISVFCVCVCGGEEFGRNDPVSFPIQCSS